MITFSAVLRSFTGVLLLGTGTLTAQCTYYLELIPQFEDGWRGGEMAMHVDGETIYSGLTLTDDDGSIYYPLEVAEGQTVAYSFTPYLRPGPDGSSFYSFNFVNFKLYNAAGEVQVACQHNDGNGNECGTGGGFIAPACQPCELPFVELLDLRVTAFGTAAEIDWIDDEVATLDVELVNLTTLDTSYSYAVTVPYTPTDLAADTPYAVRVRTVCDTLPAAWSAPRTFRTGCATLSVPYAQSFLTLPWVDCWQEAVAGSILYGPGPLDTSGWTLHDFANSTTDPALRVSLNATNQKHWVLPPPFFVPPTGSYRLSFEVAVTQPGTGDPAVLNAYTKLHLLRRTAATNQWETVRTVDATTPLENGRVSIQYPLIDLGGRHVEFALLATVAGSGQVVDLFVDDFRIRPFFEDMLPALPDSIGVVSELPPRTLPHDTGLPTHGLVALPPPAHFEPRLIPNPTVATTALVVHSGHAEPAILDLLDLDGRLIDRRRIQLSEGEQRIEVEAIGARGAGLYLVRLRSANLQLARRVLKR